TRHQLALASASICSSAAGARSAPATRDLLQRVSSVGTGADQGAAGALEAFTRGQRHAPGHRNTRHQLALASASICSSAAGALTAIAA
ncbi:hypothetical protein, partial [Pseudomonas fluorescens]|uniref:hypothetical protein n=1 Tax=Pseudomonas fluorescens TaxID=294 RepID=UPI001CD64821